jgi:hypothetical protein
VMVGIIDVYVVLANLMIVMGVDGSCSCSILVLYNNTIILSRKHSVSLATFIM